MDTLPNELLYFILSYCREYTVYLGRVSKLWYSFCKEIKEKENYTSLDLLDRACQEKNSSFFPYLSRSIFREAIREGKISILNTYEERVDKTERKKLRRRLLRGKRFVNRAHLKTIQHYFPRIRNSCLELLEREALRRDDPFFLEWLRKEVFLNPEEIFFQALRGGKIKLLNYLEKEVNWKKRKNFAYYLSYVYESFLSLLWLKERGVFVPVDIDFLCGAIREERLDLIEEFWEVTERKQRILLEQALFYGKERVFFWLLEKTGIKLTSSFFHFAREEKTRELLHSLGCPWDDYCYFLLIEEGDIKGLKWTQRKGYPLSEEVLLRGLFARDLEVIDWFFETVKENLHLLTSSLINAAELRIS